jgi:hypothetical protein
VLTRRWVLILSEAWPQLSNAALLTWREIGSLTGWGIICQLYLKMAAPATLDKINMIFLPKLGNSHLGDL